MQNHNHLPIIDLHCDLLSYLAGDEKKRTAFDSASRASIPQLRDGGVVLQTMAIFTTTGGEALQDAATQGRIYSELGKRYPEHFAPIATTAEIEGVNAASKILTLAAIENASGFCDENEPVADGLKRFEALLEIISPLAYLSLTWRDENRFGGGDRSSVGLKDDGRRVLDLLAIKNVPIDFSHTSDALAADIFNHLDKHSLSIPVLASHSNYRPVTDVPRNLPDEFAREIFKRGGVIGFNAVERFMGGDSEEAILRHFQYGEKLGGRGKMVLGADFFCTEDSAKVDSAKVDNYPSPSRKFAPFFENASTYQVVLNNLVERLNFDRESLAEFANRTAKKFLTNVVGRQT